MINNMEEQWLRWNPIIGLEKKYDIDSMIYDVKRFIILFSQYYDEGKKVKLIFENSIDAYRWSNETLRYKLILDLDKKYGADFYGDATFFKVDNSSYIQWISQQSCTISDSIKYIHFAFITANSILDIVTTYEPKVEIINVHNG